jgi:hypothetical protein
MAMIHVDPRSPTNGAGTAGDPKNTFAGITWTAGNTYLTYGGTFLETITLGANNVKVIAASKLDPPIVDCTSTLSAGINTNLRVGCEISGFVVKNQNAAAPNAAIRVTGSRHHIHHNTTLNSRHGIHLNSSFSNTIEFNNIDVGRTDDLVQGWGIRLNGAATLGNIVRGNRIICTRATPVMYSGGGAVYGEGIESFGATYNLIIGNILSPAMCDHILLKGTSIGNKVWANYCFGTGMLDGIDVLDSDANSIINNTIIHPGDVPGHAGPCMAIGDNYGSGVASTNTIVRNNILRANNRLCYSIRPLGAGFVVSNDRLYVTGITGDAVANVDEGGGLVATNMATWLAKAYVTDDTYGDPEVALDGTIPSDSDMLGAGLHVAYMRDCTGKMFYNPPSVGAFEIDRARLSRS